MTFPDIAAKPALTAQSRGGFLLPQTKEIWLTGHLCNIEYCLLEVKICLQQIISLKGQEKGAGIGDREPIIVNISHESKSGRNSETAIWQWMCLIG